MLKQIAALLFFTILALAACNTTQPKIAATISAEPIIEVFRAPTWGCCGDWIAYMQENGFTVDVKDVENLTAVKTQHQIPAQLQSCHTAIVDGYIVEGHVPVDAIQKLLAERPNIKGLAVPGMPVGSPGMEMEGVAPQPFDVIAFDNTGNMEIFASYNGN